MNPLQNFRTDIALTLTFGTLALWFLFVFMAVYTPDALGVVLAVLFGILNAVLTVLQFVFDALVFLVTGAPSSP